MVRWLLILAACKPHEVEQKPVEPERPIDAAPIDAVPPDARVKVVPPATAVALADGDAACAVMSDATVRCADGAPAVSSVKSVATADGTACALLDDGSVSCWGKLGWSGKTAAEPTGVLGVVGVTRLWVRSHLGCGQVATGLICWGAIDPQGHPAISGMRQPTPRRRRRVRAAARAAEAVEEEAEEAAATAASAEGVRHRDRIRRARARSAAEMHVGGRRAPLLAPQRDVEDHAAPASIMTTTSERNPTA